jgi:hypothetical protein
MYAMGEFVQLADIPDSLKEEAFRCLAHYSVGFLWLEDTPQGWDAALRGSGTLVAIGKRFAILTAHHVRAGGGLWQIPLVRGESGKLTQQTPLLSGVAFYQDAVTDAGSGLKCHGRLSVYGVAYDAIAKSNL